MRIVADTNVLVSALLFGGVPELVVAGALRGDVVLVTSEFLLSELDNVLARKFRLPARWCQEAVGMLRALAEIVEPKESVSEIVACPADNRVLEVALEGRVEAIVTGDARHLLPLRRFRGIPILTPAELVRVLPPAFPA